MNIQELIIPVAGIVVVVSTVIFIVIKASGIFSNTGSYDAVIDKLVDTFPKQLTSLDTINSLKEEMTISASTTDTYLYFAALMLLALDEAGKEKIVRIPDKKMNILSTKLGSRLAEIFLAFSRMSVKKKDLLNQLGDRKNELEKAWAKGLSERNPGDFSAKAPHKAVAKAMSLKLRGSLHLDFIKFVESHLSGNIVLIREILGAGQACYNLL